MIAGFEATGNYHRPLAYRLLAAGVSLRLVSSVALARTREALHNSWDKNEPKDAQVILHMLRIGATQVYFDPRRRGARLSSETTPTLLRGRLSGERYPESRASLTMVTKRAHHCPTVGPLKRSRTGEFGL